MAFPPNFLDELRNRVALAEVIQRRTRLVKKGREYSGLCPFHNEKSPSFTVNEDKGFYHCFGCGAHGDVIGFVMQVENKSFVEAVEGLAAEAGMQLPKQTPEARQEAVRQATLHDVAERAAQFFQAQLAAPAGAEARAYLERRGVSTAMIERFRIGYAGGQLRAHMLEAFPEPLIAEAGLIGRNETQSFDYFRQRLMFPIADRAGRVIAFGGRVLGDAKPKYLNSPDTPIFHKGTVLYGLSYAKEGVRQGNDIIVTEGYLDVVALHQAGFAGAVAPLGTALTEQQLAELWKLAAEPILCFDGDAAGARAAVRALDRALPLVNPGRSIRFVALPADEDPDTVIGRYGAGRMRELLATALPMAEFIWSIELRRRPVDTPERRADLSARLAARAAQVADETLRREYSSFFRNCSYERLRTPRRGGSRKPQIAISLPPDPSAIRRYRQEALVAIMLDHPELLDELIEDFAGAELTDRTLDQVRREIINIYSRGFSLDAKDLKHHLCTLGLDKEVTALGMTRVLEHARFALSGDREQLIAGWQQVLGFLHDEGEPETATRTEMVDQSSVDLQGVVDRVNAMHGEVRRRRQAETDSSANLAADRVGSDGAG